MNHKIIYFLVLFISHLFVVNSMAAQELIKMNIIATRNNSLIHKGRIDFVPYDNKEDTIHCKYYLGAVEISKSDYDRLKSAKDCDIIITHLHIDSKYFMKDHDYDYYEWKTYKIPNVHDVAESKVLILAVYQDKKKKEYDYGYQSQLFDLYTYLLRGPQHYRTIKKFNSLLEDFTIGG